MTILLLSVENLFTTIVGVPTVEEASFDLMLAEMLGTLSDRHVRCATERPVLAHRCNNETICTNDTRYID